MNRRVTTITFTRLLAIGLLSGSALPSAAQEPDGRLTPGDEEYVSFSVLGDLDTSKDEMHLAELEDIGVTLGSLEMVGVQPDQGGELTRTGGTETRETSPVEVAPAAAYDIISTWFSKDNKYVYLREAPHSKIV